MARREFIRRYTNFASCLDILSNAQLTLLSPQSWDDRSDREYMQMYRDACGFSAVYALCFTQALETYQHWKVFAPDAHGVCIYFNKTGLEETLDSNENVYFDKVEYRSTSGLRNSNIDTQQIAFTKLRAYRVEEELRLLGATNAAKPKPTMTIPFDLSVIEKIKLSPWLPEPLVRTLKTTLHAAAPKQRIMVTQSRVIEKMDWMQ